ncbi:NLP/P60 [Nitratireductor indicus C115]|uniref:NLP/P60 n=1 Tax=Nitratireductor indicus C115 TaxID=1231190 RepID=K2P2I4_9HYPH|nr:NlpC/P60 family protein [Nitratireductor indicus]EKF44324.1 NLP/P60 [Nitratireductor indicus C115]SFQ27468.1 NlpC/P60 family protein [Nitratireductor indicus]
MTSLDRRLNAFRPDLADLRLKGQVDASRFSAGESARVTTPVLDVHSAPDRGAGMDTQFLCGQLVRVFERQAGWAWVQAERDGYVGYVSEAGLGDCNEEATHHVIAQRSFVYPKAELKAPIIGAHSMGASLRVVGEEERRGTRYFLLASGSAMIARHLSPISSLEPDYVTVAERFLHTPYLWGGASGFGIDCSGLVQLSMHMAGRQAPRDTDMQARGIGAPFDPAQTPLRRGDLVFWRGHVAIMLDSLEMVHANGHTMTVAREPLREAIDRIAPLYGQPTGYRRP